MMIKRKILYSAECDGPGCKAASPELEDRQWLVYWLRHNKWGLDGEHTYCEKHAKGEDDD